MLLFIVFITEWALLMVEMVAFKTFAVHFGGTIYVWGNVIGMVMIGSSAGYYCGGRIADARPCRKNLMAILLVAGLFIVTLPFFISIFFSSFNVSENFFWWAFVLSLFLCGLPALLIEMTPPFAVRLINKNLSETGISVGKVYGFSALGGIAGIVTSSFVTLPFFGARETLFIAGGVLIFTYIFSFFRSKFLVKVKNA